MAAARRRGRALHPRAVEHPFRGHAIEARLCAEDPAQASCRRPGASRCGSAPRACASITRCESGAQISRALRLDDRQVIAHGATATGARAARPRARRHGALGVATNKAFLAAVLRDAAFAGGADHRVPGPLRACAREGGCRHPGDRHEGHCRNGSVRRVESWSNNPARAMWAKFAGTDVALTHSGDEYRAEVGETRIVLRALSINPPRARVVIDGAEEVVMFLIEGDTVHLARGGASHSLQNTIHAPAHRAAAASDGRVTAPMNGRVVAVNVRPGDSVEAGRALVVLEAMKMEHVLNVPVSSRVKAVHVAAGAQVSPGQLLVELEAS